MTTHHPIKPAWTCGGCAGQWPCPTRRRELRAEYDRAPVSLALHLGAHLVDATQDLAHVPAGHLHHRFLGWTR
ncbi:flavin reductase [Micromonospora echinofusca]|uniref:flavin reductase n=1 Tax=Micromonospora echinofusca TaxID=47858 RepID=UPI000C701B5C|nr:flavin reductase [Micromonospora sp. MSM11]MCL7456811.1 flavin reductase [Micromonospora sp. MSM11]